MIRNSRSVVVSGRLHLRQTSNNHQVKQDKISEISGSMCQNSTLFSIENIQVVVKRNRNKPFENFNALDGMAQEFQHRFSSLFQENLLGVILYNQTCHGPSQHTNSFDVLNKSIQQRQRT